jgi:hypothetical protein
MANFVPIPPVPFAGAANWQVRTIGALKQNVELLCGIRGEQDLASAALFKGDVYVDPIGIVNILSAQTLPLYTTTSFSYSGNQVLTYNTDSATIPVVINAAARYSDAVLLLQELKNLREAVINLSAALRS